MSLKFETITAKSISYGAKRDYSDIKYIVIHYTGNDGDTAKNNATYFANSNTREAGAHCFVDGSGVVYKSVPINRVAYAVGGFYTQSNGAGRMYKKVTNANSLSIEMCNSVSSVPDDVFNDAVELTKFYMNKYNVPASNVYRHWDVNGKSCPAPWASKNSSGWTKFKKAIGASTSSTTSSSASSSSSSSSSSSGSSGTITVDGYWGKNTTKRLQQILGTTVDGAVSHQYKTYKSDNPGLDSGWKWEDNPSGYSPLIKAVQKKVGATQDGYIGPKTIKAIQKWMGTTQDGCFSAPSPCIKKLQQWINKQ